jgi:hypothetical protein
MYKIWLLLISAFFVLFSEDILGQNTPKDTLSVIEDITQPKDSLVHSPVKISGKWDHLSDSLFITTNPKRINRELFGLLQKLYSAHPNIKKIPVTNVNLTAYDGLIIRKFN